MSMYALQVMTGMEAEITQKLRGKGVDARCPQERRMIRRGGKWQEQLYTLFPSYIFVSTPDVYRVYYAVRHEDGVLHWLGATKGTPEALSAHEEANILWLAGDGPLPPSEAEMQADGTLDFTSGPLAHLKDMLEKVNRHDRRVTVRVPVGGEDKTITLSYRLNGRQETASKAFAEYDPAELGAVNVTVQLYTCKKEGKVYQLTGSGAVGRCKIPAAWASGDTWKVNGTAVPAYCGADAVDGDCVVAGRWVLFTFDGAQLNFNGGGGLSNGKLARATASEAQVLAGAPFYAGNKTLKIGMMRNHGSWPDADKLTIESGKLKMYKQDGYTEGGLGVAATNLGNAQAEHLLSGVSASSQNGLGFGGSMPDRSGWSATITPGGVVTIPEGYHAGGGMVSAKGIQVTEVWQSCHGGQNLFNFSGGTLVGVQYAGSQYASDNILQGAGINSGSQYWAQCASDASVRFILAYY